MPILDVNKLHLKSVAMHWNFFFLVVGIPKFLILAPPLQNTRLGRDGEARGGAVDG